jgi:hypothetical protein
MFRFRVRDGAAVAGRVGGTGQAAGSGFNPGVRLAQGLAKRDPFFMALLELTFQLLHFETEVVEGLFVARGLCCGCRGLGA